MTFITCQVTQRFVRFLTEKLLFSPLFKLSLGRKSLNEVPPLLEGGVFTQNIWNSLPFRFASCPSSAMYLIVFTPAGTHGELSYSWGDTSGPAPGSPCGPSPYLSRPVLLASWHCACLPRFYAPRNSCSWHFMDWGRGKGGSLHWREFEEHSRTFRHLPPGASRYSSCSDLPRASSYLPQGLCSCRSLCWNAFLQCSLSSFLSLLTSLFRKAASSRTPQPARPPSPCSVSSAPPCCSSLK